MLSARKRMFALIVVLFAFAAMGADWNRFRGPGAMGVSQEKDLPSTWSSKENVVWKTELPGPGASSPITVGDRVYITAYSGYGLEANEGDQENLRRHLLCLDRASGKVLFSKEFEPKLPEHKYQGEGSYHGYAASTPASDGERLYVFFGKSGVYCFDLEGKELWRTDVGEGLNRWGSGTSPILFGNLLIINASVESSSLVALDKMTGDELWRADKVRAAWNTPLLVEAANKRTELVVSTNSRLLAFDPKDGQPLWNSDGVHRYVCPSVVAHDGVVYALGGGHTSLAVRAGGEGDVTESHGVWRTARGSNVSSPIYHQGHLYWTRDGASVCCQDAATGEMVYQQRLQPGAGRIWSSPVLAGGKLYFVSQHKGTFVVAAKPEFELVAHNVLEEDDSRTNASPAVSNGQLLLRTDRFLYCIGNKE